MANFRKEFNSNVSSRLEQKTWKGSTPKKEKTQVQSEYFNYKAFRDLQNVGNIEVKADPLTDATKGSYPYYIVSATNKVVDAKYPGVDNIEGNSITRLQNSVTSKLLNAFDIVTINKRINYLYLCYVMDNNTKRNNIAANMEMVKAFEEAAAKGYSTMLTQLPFFTQTVTTNMPNPTIDEAPVFSGATAANYTRLAALLHYQTVLQNAVAPLSKYIQLRSLEQTMLNMSYRRESQLLTQLLGQLKKSAFIAQLNAIGSSILGEYFDSNWYKQMNTIMFMSSRKSNDMLSPLLTSTCTTCIPSITMTTLNEANPYYNSTNDLVVKGYFTDPDSLSISSSLVTLSFEEAIYRLLRFLDPSTILQWARKLTTDPTSVGDLTSASAYYEAGVLRLVNAINVCMTKFSTYMTEIRTFIDKLEDSGLVYWKKGMYIDVSNIKDYSPDYNKILADLVAAQIGGSATVIYDANTQRWQCWSLWNKYEGVAEFDRKSGGAFLTLGLRNMSTLQNYSDIAYCLPILFAPEIAGTSGCQAITRTGLTVNLTYTATTIGSNPLLSRLDPLGVNFQVKVPYAHVKLIGGTAGQCNAVASMLSQMIQSIAGYGTVDVSDYDYDDPDATGNTYSTSVLDPDYVCFLDIQIDDLSNEMIQFCRNYSPFRVSTPNGKRTVGLGE